MGDLIISGGAFTAAVFVFGFSLGLVFGGLMMMGHPTTGEK